MENKLDSGAPSVEMREKIKKLVHEAIMLDLENHMNADCISGVSTDLSEDPDYNWKWAGLISVYSENDDIEADIENRIKEGLKMIRDAWIDFYLYHADNEKKRVKPRRIRPKKKG